MHVGCAVLQPYSAHPLLKIIYPICVDVKDHLRKEVCYMNANYDNLPLLLTVEEMQKVLRIGRNAAYQLVKDGSIQTIRIGRSIRIPRKALIQLVERAQ